ncbi:MAG: twin-arginine translocase TatA/TatE family subunit [Dehalococcoidales bacterium]
MPFRLGPVEIILILVIIFVIFGAGRLPQLFEMVGRGVRSFRRGKSGNEGGQTTRRTKKKVIKRFED